MNFIKGPVCRGQTALDVINDRFWVFFIDPAVGADAASADLVAREAEVLRLPAAEGSNAGLLAWRALAASEDRLLAAKQQAMAPALWVAHARWTCPWSGAATATTRTRR
jgi:hypothetical protein